MRARTMGLVALLTAAVFLNCLWNSFLWDDQQFILDNAFLTSWRLLPRLLTDNIVAGAGQVSNFYRPLQSLTHAADLRVWSHAAWGHHLTNVLLHAALAAALFRLLATRLPAWPAALAALLFSLHPLQSFTAAYVSGRGDTLALLLLCLGLLAFERHRGWSLLCAAMAMLSKESLALFPVFLWLYESTVPQSRSSWRAHLPFWLLSAAYVALRLTVLNFKDTLNFYDTPNLLTEHVLFRVYTYLTTLPKGLLLWLEPLDLHHERSWAVYANPLIPRVWLSAALAAIWLAVAAATWTRARVLSVGILWWFAATLPTSNLVVLINAVFYDHWFILPGLGLAWIAGQVLTWAWQRGRAWWWAAFGAALAALGMCASLTIRHNAVWRTPRSLYTHILLFEPTSAKIHNNVAMAYADAGDHGQAIKHYRRAIALSDEYPHTHHNLANAYLALGDQPRAIEEFRKAVTLDPAFHQAWVRLGALALNAGHAGEAEEAFSRAIAAYPYDAAAYLGLAQARRRQGDAAAAAAALRAGLAAVPNDPRLLSEAR